MIFYFINVRTGYYGKIQANEREMRTEEFLDEKMKI